MDKSYLFLAPGFEEIEALATVDILRRAGMDVVTVSVDDDLVVAGAHKIPVTADASINEIEPSTGGWLILPGGMPGATNLAACERLNTMLRTHHAAGGSIAAICASPAVVLYPLGLLDGIEATCYPGFEDSMPRARVKEDGVVATSSIITGRGPGFTPQFALAIVSATLGIEAVDRVATGMLLK